MSENIIEKKKSGQAEVFQFLLVGGTAAAVNFISRIGLSTLMSYRLSIVIAYIIGMIVAFILFKHYVFEKSDLHYRQEIKNFILVNILGIIQVWFISVGLAEFFFPYISFDLYPNETAHFIGICVPAVSSYFGHKYFTFKKHS